MMLDTDDAVELTYSDRASWLETLWDALHEFRDVNIPEGPPIMTISGMISALRWHGSPRNSVLSIRSKKLKSSKRLLSWGMKSDGFQI